MQKTDAETQAEANAGRRVAADLDGTHAAPAGDCFADAVVMLARLPLTDAERADAVRRLLEQPKGNP